MNERILQLAKEAGLSYIPSSNSGPLRVEYLFPELEKFAELIVRECVSICMKNQYECTVLYNNGSVSSAEFIKEHFGIEQ